jgi:hypothetical protein
MKNVTARDDRKGFARFFLLQEIEVVQSNGRFSTKNGIIMAIIIVMII